MGLQRSDFTTALAIGPFGMMVGGLAGGLAGDRFGRRPTLIGCVVLFGALTLMMALVESVVALSLLRLLAGIGLGGAMPNAATLAAGARSDAAASIRGHGDDRVHSARRRPRR